MSIQLFVAGRTRGFVHLLVCKPVDDAIATKGCATTWRQNCFSKHLMAQRTLQRLLHSCGTVGESGCDLFLDSVADSLLPVFKRRLVVVHKVSGIAWHTVRDTSSTQLLSFLQAGHSPEEFTRNALCHPHLVNVRWIVYRRAIPDPVAISVSSHLPAATTLVVCWRRLLVLCIFVIRALVAFPSSSLALLSCFVVGPGES
mmetsp:Transcript_2070/g.5260  ORF Transcript_2070/g.5260 Transcript_2070/m.5260 type:complete len:200 (+) Transcript_2070:101-700(+)